MASKLVSHNVRAVVVVIVIATAALMIERAEAETHTVGSASGWTNTVGPDFYTSWAANHTFKVGDSLVFEFTWGEHDVARLGKEAFDACNNTDLLSLPENQGPAKYSLNQSGDYYFICVFPGHCSQGQKLSVKSQPLALLPLPLPLLLLLILKPPQLLLLLLLILKRPKLLLLKPRPLLLRPQLLLRRHRPR